MLRVVVAYGNDQTQQQIAAAFEVHVQSLWETGLKIGERYARLTEDELEGIRWLRPGGARARELGPRNRMVRHDVAASAVRGAEFARIEPSKTEHTGSHQLPPRRHYQTPKVS